jgi:hypothetical protein
MDLAPNPREWQDAGLADDLRLIFERAYLPAQIPFSVPVSSAENAGYAAATYQLAERQVSARVAKSTPLKLGNFVAVWNRRPDGSSGPLQADSGIELLAICARLEANLGRSFSRGGF